MPSHRPPAAATDAVIARSLLGRLLPATQKTLLHNALTVDVPAGATVYHEDAEPRCGLVLTGLIRVYGADGLRWRKRWLA
jgi:hypothetical protein